MSRSQLPRLRKVCLALPEAEEILFGGHTTPTFRVRNKIFAMYAEADGGGYAVWCKAPPGAQRVLVGAEPARFFVPPYLGPKGWIGVHLSRDVDWPQLTDLITDSYRLIAPKRLLASIDTG